MVMKLWHRYEYHNPSSPMSREYVYVAYQDHNYLGQYLMWDAMLQQLSWISDTQLPYFKPLPWSMSKLMYALRNYDHAYTVRFV